MKTFSNDCGQAENLIGTGAQGGCGIASAGDFPNLPGQGLDQPVL